MAICLQCNKGFHACISCGLVGHENNFCSEECWDNSREKKLLYSFVSSLSGKQALSLFVMLDDSPMDYEEELQHVLYELIRDKNLWDDYASLKTSLNRDNDQLNPR